MNVYYVNNKKQYSLIILGIVVFGWFLSMSAYAVPPTPPPCKPEVTASRIDADTDPDTVLTGSCLDLPTNIGGVPLSPTVKLATDNGSWELLPEYDGLGQDGWYAQGTGGLAGQLFVCAERGNYTGNGYENGSFKVKIKRGTLINGEPVYKTGEENILIRLGWDCKNIIPPTYSRST